MFLVKRPTLTRVMPSPTRRHQERHPMSARHHPTGSTSSIDLNAHHEC